MYNVYNENGELIGENLTEDQLIDFANESELKSLLDEDNFEAMSDVIDKLAFAE